MIGFAGRFVFRTPGVDLTVQVEGEFHCMSEPAHHAIAEAADILVRRGISLTAAIADLSIATGKSETALRSAIQKVRKPA